MNTAVPSPFPTVFDRASPGDVRLDPFPHIILENALDPALCARLVATRLTFDDMTGGQVQSSNQRAVMHGFALQTPDHIDDVWKAFVTAHLHPAVTRRVASLFAAHWPAHLPDADWLSRASYGTLIRDDTSRHDVLCDARLEMIGPCTGAPWSHRLGHVDTGNRLFSALYYLRAADDETAGGGLELFRHKDAVPETVDRFELPQQNIERVTTVPYAANTLVVFPNSPHAIHGSEPRGISARDRAYVFITAEVRDDLF